MTNERENWKDETGNGNGNVNGKKELGCFSHAHGLIKGKGKEWKSVEIEGRIKWNEFMILISCGRAISSIN